MRFAWDNIKMIVLNLFLLFYSRRKEWSDVLFNEKQRKKYASEKGTRPRPKPARQANEIENPGYKDDTNNVEVEDHSALYAQPISTSIRNAYIVKEARPLVGEGDPNGLFAQPMYKVAKVEEIKDNQDTPGNKTDEYEDDPLYAQPFQNSTFKPKTNEGPDDPKQNVEVPHEAVPDNPDVLYAKSMKSSFKTPQEEEKRDDEVSDGEAKEIVAPGVSELADEHQDHEKDEEIDLSAVVKARMSTDDDFQSTELWLLDNKCVWKILNKLSAPGENSKKRMIFGM